MDDKTTKAIDTLNAQIFALRTLLLSHIAAASESHAQLVIATVEDANEQIDAAVPQGMGREAVALKALLDALAILTGPLAFND